jgi:RecA-family ATPase
MSFNLKQKYKIVKPEDEDSKPRPRPTVTNPRSAADLQNDPPRKVKWVIPGLIPVGLSILVGSPKVGKSWFALALAIAKAKGSIAFGKIKVGMGIAHYVALEDNEGRLHERIETILGGIIANNDFPQKLLYSLEMAAIGSGGIAQLEKFLTQNPDSELIIIDTLGRIIPNSGKQGYKFEVEYMAKLQGLTLKNPNLAIMVLHHDRKAQSDDFVHLVSGTHGISGTADTVMVLKKLSRINVNAILYITGRDIEEQELKLKFDSGIWELTEELPITTERNAIIELLKKNGPMTMNEISSALNKKQENIRQLVYKLKKKGSIYYEKKVVNSQVKDIYYV